MMMTMTTTMIVLMSFYEQLSWMSDNHWSFCGLVLMETQVGILPTPSRAKCGRKGFDSGEEGKAEMAEWPWHVSSQFHILRSSSHA